MTLLFRDWLHYNKNKFLIFFTELVRDDQKGLKKLLLAYETFS